MSVIVAQVLEAVGKRDARLAKDLPASGLRAVRVERGVDAVERNPEQDRELALEGRGVEDGEVCPRAVGDALADALEEARAARGSSP